MVIVDVGGTVGDIECTPFLEAVRQCRNVFGKNNAVYIHVTLVPYIGVSGEQKTKPTQHSVKELQNIGIQPDVIVCRSDFPLAQSSKDKLALFCNVDKDCIIENITTDNLFAVPTRRTGAQQSSLQKTQPHVARTRPRRVAQNQRKIYRALRLREENPRRYRR